MAEIGQTVCINCGRLRIFSRTWKEKVEGKGSVVTHTESVCPDAECQKVVDARFAEIREKKEASEEKRKNVKKQKMLNAAILKN